MAFRRYSIGVFVSSKQVDFRIIKCVLKHFLYFSIHETSVHLFRSDQQIIAAREARVSGLGNEEVHLYVCYFT